LRKSDSHENKMGLLTFVSPGNWKFSILDQNGSLIRESKLTLEKGFRQELFLYEDYFFIRNKNAFEKYDFDGKKIDVIEINSLGKIKKAKKLESGNLLVLSYVDDKLHATELDLRDNKIANNLNETTRQVTNGLIQSLDIEDLSQEVLSMELENKTDSLIFDFTLLTEQYQFQDLIIDFYDNKSQPLYSKKIKDYHCEIPKSKLQVELGRFEVRMFAENEILLVSGRFNSTLKQIQD